jgi:outer membrane protein assembly factor BamB
MPLLLVLVLLFQDWPQFRGPTGQGLSDEKGLPLTWSETEHVGWKTAIPGRGWSSPVVQGDRIWLTTATEEGRSLRAIAVDRDKGSIVHDVEVFHLRDLGNLNPKNSQASPTPIVAGDRIYVHFGAHGTAALDGEGRILWKTTLEYNGGQHGPGGSPVLYEDLLIVSCDGEDVQFVAALDVHTGKVRWKKRRDGYQAYSTPLVVSRADGDQVISSGAHRAIAYEPRTGKEIWSVRYGDGFSNVPRPVYDDGLVFLCTGFQQPSLMAVRVDGKKDVTRTHVAWTTSKGVPLTSSPIAAGGVVYFVNDAGIASALDAKTGAEIWRVRLPGEYSASPIYADGRLYFLSEDGETIVVAPGKEFRALARNRLDGPTLASMAVSHGAIFIRSQNHLYRLSN